MNTKTAQIISELIAVYVKLGKIKSQPLTLGALGKQCELWLVDGYLYFGNHWSIIAHILYLNHPSNGKGLHMSQGA